MPREKHNPEKQIAYIAIHILPPYQALQSLEDEAKRVENFKIDKSFLVMMEKAQKTIDKEKRIAVRNSEYIPEDFGQNMMEIEEPTTDKGS